MNKKFCGNKLGTVKMKRKQLRTDIQPLSCLTRTPNRAVLEPILADLDRLWEMRHWIPKPENRYYQRKEPSNFPIEFEVKQDKNE